MKAGAIIISCDIASAEAQDTVNICYEIQENCPAVSTEREEFFTLITIAKNEEVQFTAADFFQVNRSIFFDILNVTVMYIIIVIQFYE